MAVDLKVLARSFNCESRSCYVGNLRIFFFEFAFFSLFAKDSPKLDSMNGLEAHPYLPLVLPNVAF